MLYSVLLWSVVGFVALAANLVATEILLASSPFTASVNLVTGCVTHLLTSRSVECNLIEPVGVSGAV